MPSHLAHPRRGVVGLVLGLLLLCAPTAARAAETGVVPDLTWGIDNTAKQQTTVALQELGAQWVRMSVSWSDDVEPRKGSYSSTGLSRFDSAVDAARSAGYRVILMVEESPSWAHDGTNKNSPPRDNADLADFMGFLAARYVGKVEAYEVWNEPNLSWAWPSGPNPAEYAHMLRTVAPAIRAADPSAKVVFAGLFRNDWAYLERAYDAIPNLGDYFDVMATHPYPYKGAAPESVWLDPNGRINEGAFSAYREVRATMEKHGDSKPIWFTEFGWSTSTQQTGHNYGVTPELQAEYLVRAYNCLEQDPYVEVATWYNLRNEFWKADADTWVSQLGLMTTDFTRKPAFYALKNYTPGSGTCRYADPAPPAPPAGDDPIAPEPAPATAPWQPITPPPLKSPRLAVQRALIRDGRLVVTARIARAANGVVRGIAAYGDSVQRFTARADETGRLRVRTPLPRGTETSAGWVALDYARDARFHRQRVVLLAAARSARLKLLPDAESASTRSRSVTGTLAAGARGAVALTVTYRRPSGAYDFVTRRSKVRSRRFRAAFRLPVGATDAILYAVYAGDPTHGIGGGSRVVALP